MHYSQLGYDNYDEYLAGQEWKEIHDLFYLWGGIYRCSICYQPAKLLLHKRSYAYLTPDFFDVLIRRKKFKLLRKILSWKCYRCNDLCHFYDKKKSQKVPLDYLFLWERELSIHRRPDMAIRRFFRNWKRLNRWMYYAFMIPPKRKVAF